MTGSNREKRPLTTRRIALFDPDALTETVPNSRFEHRQLREGLFHGELRGGDLGGCLVSCGCYNQTLQVRGDMPRDAVVFATILDAREDGYMNGFRFARRDMAFFPAHSELDYVLPAYTRWAAVQVPLEVLRSLPGAGAERGISSTQVLPAADPASARVARLIQRLLTPEPDDLAGEAPLTRLGQEQVALEQVGMELAQALDALAAGGSEAAWSAAWPSYAKRMHLLRSFEASVRDRLGEKLLIPRLCAELGVPQRTLEQSFRDQIGLSPRRYLEVLRLNAVREALLAGDAGEDGVGAVARRFGLSQPGRFSGLYRALFGELPSATAKAARGFASALRPAL